jgi:dihydropteroate synthase
MMRDHEPCFFRCGRFCMPIGHKTHVMGIINVTPDSFSDGGRFLTPEAAVRQAKRLKADGADILDIGGESTRPGSLPVDEKEEQRRVVPVVEALAKELDGPISIDTSKASVARAALAAGAVIVNDVTGLRQDEKMAQLVKEAKAGVIIMHNARLYQKKEDDLVDQMIRFFQGSLALAKKAGLQSDQIVLDPGIGFGVTTAESIVMIQALPRLRTLGYPLMVGPSRKRFIGCVLDQPVENRLMGTAAAVSISIAQGADFVRIHDVKALIDVVRMSDALCRPSEVGE